MRKIKFKTEYVPLSDEVINSHKNFDQLLSAYAAAPKPNWFKQFIQKKWTMFGGGLMTGAIITSILWYNQESLFVDKAQVQESVKPAIQQHIADGQVAEPVDTLQNHLVNEVKPESTGIVGAAEQIGATAKAKWSAESGDVIANENSIVSKKSFENTTAVADQGHEIYANKSIAQEQQPVTAHGDEGAKEATFPVQAAIQQDDANEMAEEILSQAGEDVAITEQQNNSNQVTPVSVALDTAAVAGSMQSSESTVADTNQSLEETAQTDTGSKDKDGHLITGALAGAAIVTAPATGDVSKSGKSGKGQAGEKKKTNAKESRAEGVTGHITPIDTSTAKNEFKEEKKSGWFAFKKDSVNDVKAGGGTKTDTLQASGKTPDQLSQDSLYQLRYAQVSFITPLSSNGIDGYKYLHYVSLNVLQGYNGALKGAEFGGLINGVKGYVTGAQFGGLGNFAGGNLKGAQFGGLANFAGGFVRGAQFGGLVNVGETVTGAQFAGITNVSGGYVNGFQAAGITNISADSLNGAQVAGIANVVSSSKQSTGWQIAGVGNVIMAETKGGQISGVFNVANRLVGGQISLINYGKKIDGVQIGLINVSDSLDGAAIGLVSVSSDGVFDVALWTSDFLMFNGGIRVGTKSVYNIYAYGVSPFLTELPFGFGIGIGGHIPVKKKAFIEIDGMAWSMHRSYISFDEINMINQLRVMGGYRFNKYLSVFAGPTFNVSVQSNRYEPFLDNYFYESVSENNTVRLAPGFVAGIRLF